MSDAHCPVVFGRMDGALPRSCRDPLRLDVCFPMYTPRRIGSSRRIVAATALFGLLTTGAACSGGDGQATVASTTPDTVRVSTTSEPATTTTFAQTTTAAPTTTTDPGPPVYPLTGLPAVDPAIAARPTLVVKIDNAGGARPQTGFNAADIVYEEIVNAKLSRFAMVFQSRGSDPVGPIRSGRLQDINLFGSYNHPLFAWSGGNTTVTAAVDASDLINLSQLRVGVYFRTTDKEVPHNLYSNTSALWKKAPFGAQPPVRQFTYRRDGAAPIGAPSAGVATSLDSVDVRWEWNKSKHLYYRTMEGNPHNDAAGGQVTTDNVVVLAMEYTPGISDSPDAQTIGKGEAFVFTGGNYVHATWARADRLVPFVIKADDGSVVGLTPGRTFVELPRVAKTLPLGP